MFNLKKLATLSIVLLLIVAFCKNSFAQWIEQSSGTTNWLTSVYAPEQEVAWISGLNGSVLRTEDNGNHWLNISFNPDQDHWSVYAFDERTALVTAQDHVTYTTHLYRTSNGGQTWQLVLSHEGGFFDALTFFDKNNGLLYGDPVNGFWDTFRTNDGGKTWTVVTPSLPQTDNEFGWNNAMKHVGNTVYFGTTVFDSSFNFGPNARVYRSTNRGGSWTRHTTPGSVETNSLHFINAMTGYANGSKTTNGGETWFTMTDPYPPSSFPGNQVQTVTGINTKVWVTGRTSHNLFYSTNGGISWTLNFTRPGIDQNDNLEEVTRTVKFDDDQYSLFVTTHEGGIAMNRFGDDSPLLETKNNTFIKQGSSNKVSFSEYKRMYLKSHKSVQTVTSVNGNKNYSLMKNYPNPFNPTTKISYNLPVDSKISIKVFDIIGQLVTTLFDGYQTSGLHEVEFNANGLASGIYFYRMSATSGAGSFTDTKKMILTK